MCDGVIDCFLAADDEYGSALIRCPVNCSCLNYAILCNNTSSLHQNIYLPFHKVIIVNVPVLVNINDVFPSVGILIMSETSVFSICNLRTAIFFLHISFTNATKISIHCFSTQKALKSLNISRNLIFTMSCNAFDPNNTILSLDISFNKLETIEKCTFSLLKYLLHLSIQGNAIVNLHVQIFEHQEKINLILSENFHICCLVYRNLNKDQNILCDSQPPWPSSCSDLLTNISITCMAWIFAFGTCVFNIYSMFISIISIWKHRKKAFMRLMLGINLIDITYGIYLLSIACADSFYRGTFVINELKWRKSFLCNMLSVLSMFSVLGSVCGLNLITFSRLQITVSPLSSKFTNPTTSLKWMLMTFVSMIIFTGLLHCIYILYRWSLLQPSVICTLLGNTDGSISLFLINIFISVSQLLAIFSITIMYYKIVMAMKESSHGHDSSKRQKQNRMATYKIVLLAATNILSWLPSSIIYILSTVLVAYPTENIMWTLVAINPLNPFMNPLIFNIAKLGHCACCGKKKRKKIT